MSTQKKIFPFWQYLAPKYWLTWFGLGLLRTSILLPQSALVFLGKILGTLSYYLAPQQRKIALANITACFPELNKYEQVKLVRASMNSVGTTVFETALSWWGDKTRLHNLYRVEGLENLQRAKAKGKPLLLLGGHYTTLDISGNFLEEILPELCPTYKAAHNRLFHAIMMHSRERVYRKLIPSKDMRTIIRTLKNGGIVWYAPDQDFGRDGSVFAPFLGVQTATLTITARLAKLADAIVIPYSSRRQPDGKSYVIHIDPALENFPSNDEVADATLINQALARNIKLAPEQYLWVHRRFKTRPIGEAQFYPLRRDKRLKRYSLTLALLSLPAIAYTAWMAWQHRDWQYWRERIGLKQSITLKHNKQIWIHAASVGEVNAVRPLVELITGKYPDISIYFTTATPTGQINARNKLPENVECHYLPIDWWHAVKPFISTIKPECALIVETEIWPNLYEACHAEGVPIVIINGRLSSRTLTTNLWLHSLYCKTMENVNTVLARSEDDAKGFTSINLPEDKIKVIGNIKFAAVAESCSASVNIGRPYVLAASTRDNEEKLIVKTWLKQDRNNHLLVIVPRHPRRLSGILKDLAVFEITIAIRSKNEPVTDQTQIYIADTFGELPAFIAGSQFVIMGGSFVNKGGQNIIEVARQGKAVIFGSHMKNFTDEAQLFLHHHAGIQAQTETELDDTINLLLNDKQKTESLGNNGLMLIQHNNDIAQRYLTELEHLSLCFK